MSRRLLTFDKDEITIGRVSGNDIVLAKGNVSKRHSRFTVKSPGQIEVADLKSTNGTYVNGRKIGSPMLLSASDWVYVGDFLINIDLGGGAASGRLRDDFPGDSPAAPAVAARGTGCRSPSAPAARSGRLERRAASRPTTTATAKGTPDSAAVAATSDELGLAARPPGSGRVPIPPPPPPRRPPTPLASRGLGESDFDDGLGSAAPAATDEPAEDTGSVGLFAHSRSPDDESSRPPGGRAARRRGSSRRPPRRLDPRALRLR